MKYSLQNIISNARKLVSFPSVANELFAIVDNESSDAQDISNIIQKDPALSAAVLKLANSAWYMSRDPASSIESAVVRIGTANIGRIALNICVQESFKNIPENLFSLSDYFYHSLRCAFASQEVARRIRLSNLGTMYAAGLLHDIGQIILLNVYPEQSSEALALNIEEYDGLNLHTCEKKVFGFDHTQVGNELAKTWNFPPVLQQTIRYHHLPANTPEINNEICCVHIANSIAMMNEYDSDDLNDAPEIQQLAFDTVSLDKNAVINLANISNELFKNNREKMSLQDGSP